MKNKPTVTVAALALCLFAVFSALGQTLVCTERVVDGTTPEMGFKQNWYATEGRMVFGPQDDGLALAFDPEIVHEPNASYPIVYYYLSIGGSPTSDSFAGTGEFTFPPQADGVEIQVHYQKVGDDWDVGTTRHLAGAQVVTCPHMVVNKGWKTSFVVRVVVQDWVPNGTPINVELKSITGLFGVTLGEIPELHIVTYTGPWKLTWWKHPAILAIEKPNNVLTVAAPPHFWESDWTLEASTDLQNWKRENSTALTPFPKKEDYPVARSVKLAVNPGGAKIQFYRFTLNP